jgi:molybdopterin/thiamine biosynthesis adenylyltransferase
MSRADTNPFFYNSTLLFSEPTMERIETSVVGVVGVGGVGAVALEMLVRTGVSHVRVADPDVYEAVNLNRQLFATQETLGRNKDLVAAVRVRAINPASDIAAVEQGVLLSNVEGFVRGCDVLLCQCDRESSKVLLHRAARRFAVPVVSGGRSSIHDHRWKVAARVYDYRGDPTRPCYDEVFHPAMERVPFESLTEELLRAYDGEVTGKDRGVFRDLALDRPELYGSIDVEELKDRLASTERYNKRTVCAVIANTAGCLVATAALKVLIGGPTTELSLDLWNGPPPDVTPR